MGAAAIIKSPRKVRRSREIDGRSFRVCMTRLKDKGKAE